MHDICNLETVNDTLSDKFLFVLSFKSSNLKHLAAAAAAFSIDSNCLYLYPFYILILFYNILYFFLFLSFIVFIIIIIIIFISHPRRHRRPIIPQNLPSINIHRHVPFDIVPSSFYRVNEESN